MGRKLDALLGRNFKTYKFKALINLAISRLAVLKNQRQVRCSQARSDVVKLLQLGHHERALLRVEQVIKEQNMLDVFIMIEGYCNLLIERVHLIEQERECPDELKEAISSLLHAASRCGEFPELQEIRATLTSRFGKEFAARAIELRNNCGVNHQMILKLSTRMPSLENRMKVLKEIASENNITLQLDQPSFVSNEELLDADKKQKQSESNPSTSSAMQILPEQTEKDEGFSDSIKTRQKYRDVAAAAQAAFESAAYAATAARAAVELSRSHPHDPDDHDSPNRRRRKPSDRYESDLEIEEISNENQAEGSKQSKNETEFNKSVSASSSDSESVGQADPLGRDLVFDETRDEENSIPILNNQNFGFDMKASKENRPMSVRTSRVRGY